MRRLLQFLSFLGRTSRAPFWAVTVALQLLVFVAWNLVNTLGRHAPWLVIAFYVLLVAAELVNAAVAVRRLHDRNRSGWWILLLGFVPGFLSGLAQGGLAAGKLKDTSALALMVIALIILAWAIVELGVLRGTKGPNRFGEDPLATAA